MKQVVILLFCIVTIHMNGQQHHDEENVVFNHFPDDTFLFRDDVKTILDTIIKYHGEEEWKACVLTNEIHGHLGIYSLIGAKMGIKAREYFNVPTDQLKVVSFAGNIPPISCFSDGLQVSTGATLGQGTIKISTEDNKRPEAIFINNADSLKLKLKDEYWQVIKDDISRGIVEYGLESDRYWNMIRSLGLKYWLEFDRNAIFEIVP